MEANDSTFSIHFHYQHQCIYISTIIVCTVRLSARAPSGVKKQGMSIKSHITCWQHFSWTISNNHGLIKHSASISLVVTHYTIQNGGVHGYITVKHLNSCNGNGKSKFI